MAEKPDILETIEALTVHCRPPIMDLEQRSRWLQDWCIDLAEFPIDAIRTGCAEWRKSGSAKFPTPGMLIPIIRRFVGAQSTAERVEVWRPLEDGEYQSLSLSDKIRHHRILAHQARRKAGPMWRNGRPASPDELPPSWNTWTRQAEHHEDEAARLSKFLRRPQAEAAE